MKPIDTAQSLLLAKEATRLMKALAHPERLMICCQLREEGELSVGAIEEALGIAQPRLSRELSKLRAEGILGTRRQSKAIFYHLRDDRIKAIVATLCDVIPINDDDENAPKTKSKPRKKSSKRS